MDKRNKIPLDILDFDESDEEETQTDKPKENNEPYNYVKVEEETGDSTGNHQNQNMNIKSQTTNNLNYINPINPLNGLNPDGKNMTSGYSILKKQNAAFKDFFLSTSTLNESNGKTDSNYVDPKAKKKQRYFFNKRNCDNYEYYNKDKEPSSVINPTKMVQSYKLVSNGKTVYK